MKGITRTILLSGVLASASASATILQHNFTISGPGGLTGSGYFTYDDTVVSPGNPVGSSVIYYQFSMTGGLAGAGVSFTISDCASDPALFVAPDFTNDINFFDCDNGGGFTGYGVDPFTFQLSDPTGAMAEVVFTPGATIVRPAEQVPALPLGALGLLAGLLGWTGFRRLRK